MAELADALDLGSSAFRRAGSIPVARTTKKDKSSLFVKTFLFAFFVKMFTFLVEKFLVEKLFYSFLKSCLTKYK